MAPDEIAPAFNASLARSNSGQARIKYPSERDSIGVRSNRSGPDVREIKTTAGRQIAVVSPTRVQSARRDDSSCVRTRFARGLVIQYAALGHSRLANSRYRPKIRANRDPVSSGS